MLVHEGATNPIDCRDRRSNDAGSGHSKDGHVPTVSICSGQCEPHLQGNTGHECNSKDEVLDQWAQFGDSGEDDATKG